MIQPKVDDAFTDTGYGDRHRHLHELNTLLFGDLYESQLAPSAPTRFRRIESENSTSDETLKYQWNILLLNSRRKEDTALTDMLPDYTVPFDKRVGIQVLLSETVISPICFLTSIGVSEGYNKHDLLTTVQNTLLKIPNEVDDDCDLAPVVSEIQSLLEQHGNRALGAIKSTITEETLSVDATAEILRLIGGIVDSGTHNVRRNFLEKMLFCPRSPVLRDAANLGLALMDDPKAIKSFRKAISSDKSLLLKKLLRQTLKQLENTKSELHP